MHYRHRLLVNMSGEFAELPFEKQMRLFESDTDMVDLEYLIEQYHQRQIYQQLAIEDGGKLLLEGKLFLEQ